MTVTCAQGQPPAEMGCESGAQAGRPPWNTDAARVQASVAPRKSCVDSGSVTRKGDLVTENGGQEGGEQGQGRGRQEWVRRPGRRSHSERGGRTCMDHVLGRERAELSTAEGTPGGMRFPGTTPRVVQTAAGGGRWALARTRGAHRRPESGLSAAAGARDPYVFQGTTEAWRLVLCVHMDFTGEKRKCPAGQGWGPRRSPALSRGPHTRRLSPEAVTSVTLAQRAFVSAVYGVRLPTHSC